MWQCISEKEHTRHVRAGRDFTESFPHDVSAHFSLLFRFHFYCFHFSLIIICLTIFIAGKFFCIRAFPLISCPLTCMDDDNRDILYFAGQGKEDKIGWMKMMSWHLSLPDLIFICASRCCHAGIPLHRSPYRYSAAATGICYSLPLLPKLSIFMSMSRFIWETFSMPGHHILGG